MVEKVNVNIPSTFNTVRIKRKLNKTNLIVERHKRNSEKNNKKNGKNQNMENQPEKEKQDGIDILV